LVYQMNLEPAVLFFGMNAGYITGQNILIDGGAYPGCFEYEVVLVNRRGLRDSQALVGNGCLPGIRRPGASHSVFQTECGKDTRVSNC
jgi:hypothetical protein